MAAEGPARRAPRPAPASGWDVVHERLRERGLRWTPQRRTIVEVLRGSEGHLTGAELVDRCRAVDAATIPSTVYRTLDVLEELGLVRHHHGVDGREEFHVMPLEEHGHLRCRTCGGAWEIPATEGEALVAALDGARGFAVDLSHLTIVGTCAACRVRAPGHPRD